MSTSPRLAPRKTPRQQRSRQMREDILAASLRVFRDEGALRFTTQRVADAAGISVGSLYQYFPNKHALVHALHERQIDSTWAEAQAIFAAHDLTPREQLDRLAGAFFRAEAREADLMRPLLRDAELFLQDQTATPHGRLAEALARLEVFVVEAAGEAAPGGAAFCARLIAVTLESIGKSLVGEGTGEDELELWAGACAKMLADYVGLAELA